VSKECLCGDAYGHAKAVESSVFQSLCNAFVEAERGQFWRDHADKLERKFTTAHGRHYSYFLERP
jgi:hypothetical protein